MATDDAPPVPAPAAAAAADPVVETSNTESSNAADNGDRNDRGQKRGGRGRDNRNPNRDRNNPNNIKTGGFGSNKRDFMSKRDQVQDNRAAKRRKVIDGAADGNSYMSIPFSTDEIAAEERRPKRKVAVLIGYAGTGYHGIQINHKEKTIEGDLFAAFVKAGAISKANADDPKKSSLVRCARTDKGVHAAANVLSLKLIVEDEDIVEKINSHLPDQIKVWGIQRVTNGFSCYQACDSRWYEYLMPSYALLPPQPQSFLGKKIIDAAKEKGTYNEYVDRLDDVQNFWEEVEKNDIQPILEKMDPEIRAEVIRILHDTADQELTDDGEPSKPDTDVSKDVEMNDTLAEEENKATEAAATEATTEATTESTTTETQPAAAAPKAEREFTPVELAVREVKAAYVAAKRRYRVTPARLAKLQEALNQYLGTHNFHNYTILKSHNDPSARRHIKSFTVNPTPININDTEWLSLKVHGQSFMMHQIRKMVAMAVLIVRCGAPMSLINESYGPRRISIPKAPGLGLMLERPVFDVSNKKFKELGREPIDFGKWDDQIQKFKDEHIYKRMFELEEKENSFHLFFNQIDNFRTDYFLWVTPGGIEASHERSDRTAEKIPKALQAELGDEADGVAEDAAASN
ncbi:pseudouridine synthase [Sordaria brevicollis]|uniref:tRNA pseudouridine synthase 1 n=1 Tax=Sordaria brevicollis TaxID=83679 RepID=A0AAE0UCL6_SORBR|nr:pseudouridine synthase [Sordaria brevicollis]